MKKDIDIVFFEKEHKEIVAPKKATLLSAGFDLVSNAEDFTLYPGQIKIIPTGIGLKMPSDMYADVRSRSGLSTKGVVVVNSPGTIDADYQSEIKVILGNYGHDPYHVVRFNRIAQLVFGLVLDVRLHSEVPLEQECAQRNGGFGSTGL